MPIIEEDAINPRMTATPRILGPGTYTAASFMLASPNVFARRRSMNPGWVRELCALGRITGAEKDAETGHWRIPLDASILPPITEETPGLSVAEFAAKHGRSRTRVHDLLKEERIEGAVFVEEIKAWRIPEDAPWPKSKRPGLARERQVKTPAPALNKDVPPDSTKSKEGDSSR